MPVIGAVTWTFEVVPADESADVPDNDSVPERMAADHVDDVDGDDSWNTPPAQISTQGEYDSPRGCRGTFGSFGNADTNRIQADVTGVDCPVPFTGTVTLTKN